MSFIFGKWKAVEEKKALRERYGENSDLMLRNHREEPKKKAKVKHPNQHLIGKVFKVKELNLPPVPSERPQRSYAITDEEKQRRLLRSGGKEKTRFDD